MVGETDIAVATLGHVAALAATDVRSITPSVLEDDDLFAQSQLFANLIHQRIGEMLVHFLAMVLPLEIDK